MNDKNIGLTLLYHELAQCQSIIKPQLKAIPAHTFRWQILFGKKYITSPDDTVRAIKNQIVAIHKDHEILQKEYNKHYLGTKEIDRVTILFRDCRVTSFPAEIPLRSRVFDFVYPKSNKLTDQVEGHLINYCRSIVYKEQIAFLSSLIKILCTTHTAIDVKCEDENHYDIATENVRFPNRKFYLVTVNSSREGTTFAFEPYKSHEEASKHLREPSKSDRGKYWTFSKTFITQSDNDGGFELSLRDYYTLS